MERYVNNLTNSRIDKKSRKILVELCTINIYLYYPNLKNAQL